MLRTFAIGAATLAVLGTSIAFAQQPRERPDGPRAPAFSREDAAALVDARVAALHTGLQLTPEQEKLWPAFEQAYRERAKLRLEHAFTANQPPPVDDPVARLQRRAEALLRQGAALKALADAAAPLWQSFDDGQKRRYAMLSRPTMARPGEERSAERPQGGPQGHDGDGFGERRRGFGPGGPGGFGGRDGDEYGRRGFGTGGPSGRDREFGEERGFRGFGQGGPGRRDGDEYGRGPRGFGPGGPRGGGEFGRGDTPGRYGDRFGSGREPRGFGPGGPSGRYGEFGPDRDERRMMPRRFDRDYGRDDDRDFSRDYGRDYGRDFRRDFGRDYGRGQFRWWHGPGDMGPRRGGWRDSREPGGGDARGAAPGEPGGNDERFSRGDDDEQL